MPDRAPRGTRVTDFGDRPTFIARRVSWPSGGESILAAVGEAMQSLTTDMTTVVQTKVASQVAS